MTVRDAFVVAARRTPIGRVGGMLRHLRVEDLGAAVIRAVIEDIATAGVAVDEVILGNSWGPGGNPARVAAIAAGLPASVPAVTVDRQCASGLEAINLAARLVQSGAADVCLAGGAESVSTAPWRVEKPATVYQSPAFVDRARFAPQHVGLSDEPTAVADPDMGVAADAVARAYGVTRERQDAFALASHPKALAAADAGRFDTEVVVLPGAGTTAACDTTGDARRTRDESPRGRLTMRALSGLRPAFGADGTVTAGNASPVNDGAAVVAVVSPRVRDAMGLPHALRFVDGVAAGVDPQLPGTGPIAATRRLLERVGMDMQDIDLVEVTEAFAGQTLACLDALRIPEDRVNLGGGAIALGHPWGASGAVLMTRLFTEMVRSPQAGTSPRCGLATVAGAGGVGVATLVERHT